MTVVTPKTNFYALLQDMLAYLEWIKLNDNILPYSTDDLMTRCYRALKELEGDPVDNPTGPC